MICIHPLKARIDNWDISYEIYVGKMKSIKNSCRHLCFISLMRRIISTLWSILIDGFTHYPKENRPTMLNHIILQANWNQRFWRFSVGNFCPKKSIGSFARWGAAPLCWNKMFSRSLFIYSGHKDSVIRRQYWSPFTVESDRWDSILSSFLLFNE